ncbi:uncharacterized protein LOC122071206 [Macadamia integrifolia]|uniref:uncharacterized protein LOC122071206 n=1 Tax=Macadamia integrifolia TaxID=60698 RepID=UPI001C4ECF86|nr:uncharacterized protein LOC122071206 [Macadamia integrifolia]
MVGINGLVTITLVFSSSCIWMERNSRRHDGISKSMERCFAMIRSEISSQSFIYSGKLISLSDLLDARRLRFSGVQGRPSEIFEIFWCRTPRGWWKVNIDWCSIANPGISGAGGVFHNDKGEVMVNLWISLGIHSNFVAKFMVVISGIEHAEKLGVQRLWIECDSVVVVTLVQKRNVPWIVHQRWIACMNINRYRSSLPIRKLYIRLTR